MIGWDTETDLIAPGLLAPPLACVSFGDLERAEVVHYRDAKPYVIWLLEQTACTANGPYDLGVVGSQFPDLQELVFDALSKDRVKDVQTAQKLIDIGEGCYRWVFRKINGVNTKLMYSLNDLHVRYFSEALEKDEWRLQYGKLREIYPIAAWPAGAQKYPKDDAIATARVRWAQEQFVGRLPASEYLVDESAQVRAHFALHLMACWGMKTRRSEVEALINKIEHEIALLAQPLMQAGLVKPDGKRNESAAKQRMLAVMGENCALTDTGKKKVKKLGWTKQQAIAEGYIAVDDDATSLCKDLALQAYSRYGQMTLMRSKIEGFFIDSPIQTRFEILLETGRTSSSESTVNPNSKALQNLPRYYDEMSEELAKFFNHPIPKKGETKHPGMRGMFFPREGNVYFSADAGQAELVSLSQVCYSQFGYSVMREKINAGLDVHLDFAADMLGIDYATAKANKKREDVVEHRQIAKCFHGDTEVLTRTGWVKISELNVGVEVAAASFHVGGLTQIRWEIPSRLTKRTSPELVHLYSENIDLWVTPDHRMAIWRNIEKNPLPQIKDPVTGRVVNQGGRQNNKHLVPATSTPEDFNKCHAWPGAGLCEEGIYSTDEILLRLAVATQADGNFSHKAKDGKIRLGFTKQRKIERLRSLLTGYQYEEVIVGKAKVTTFYIRDELAFAIRRLLDPDKTMPWWWLSFDSRCRKIILDEARYWDSHVTKGGRSYGFFTTTAKNAEVLQAIAVITNHKARNVYTERKVQKEGVAPGTYSLSIKDRPYSHGGSIETTKIPWGGEVYCLTVPSDGVLVRYNGVVVATFQCGDFGFPGGSGPDAFLDFARKTYGVIMTRERAVQLKKDTLAKWLEWKDYFKWIDGLLRSSGSIDHHGILRGFIKSYVPAGVTGLWRGGVAYTEACNHMFQHLTAAAMKAACFEVARACYVTKSSPMYGCRPVMFAHDEIIAEGREDQAPEAAEELSRIIVEVYSRYTPDVRITAEGQLMRQWNKSAEPVRDPKTNKLVPWEDRHLYGR